MPTGWIEAKIIAPAEVLAKAESAKATLADLDQRIEELQSTRSKVDTELSEIVMGYEHAPDCQCTWRCDMPF